MHRSSPPAQRTFTLSAWVGVWVLTSMVPIHSETTSTSPPPPPLTTEAIVQRLMAANAQRAQALRSYRSLRSYHLDYHGVFGSHDATMQVEATYSAPDRKDFKVLAESGSKLFVNHVLLKLLTSEAEAQKEQNRAELEISPRNYDFKLIGTEQTPTGDCYVLAVHPKSKSKYVYQGKIWVDAQDFAVARMQGEPARNPSLWVSHAEIEYRWARIAGFWLPVHNQATTQVRMGGKAVLTIEYTNYQVTGVNRARTRGPEENSTLPDPATVTADPH